MTGADGDIPRNGATEFPPPDRSHTDVRPIIGANRARASEWVSCTKMVTEQLEKSGRRLAYHNWSLIRNTLLLSDALAIFILMLTTHRLYLGSWLPSSDSFVFIPTTWLLAIVGLALSGAYNRAAIQDPVRSLNAIVLGGAGAVTATLLLSFTTRAFIDLSRMWVGLVWLTSAAAIITIHLITTVLVARLMDRGYLRERIALVGAGARAQQALVKFKAAESPTVTMVGVFDDRASRIDGNFPSDDLKGDTDDLIDYIRSQVIDRVILTLPWTAEGRIIQLVAKLRQTPVRVDLIPHNVIWGFPLNIERIHDVPIVTVANHRVDIQTGWLKRSEDLVIGSLMLVCFLPVLIAVALAVRLDSRGPILFRQQRVGFNNQVFNVCKFRSMSVDRPPDDGALQARKYDPRVTRVGRFIRRTSLDELPQLFNVIAGTMSLVGPRPHALPQNDQFGNLVDEYFARHNVKPGITGWAQVNGYRGETDVPEKMSNRVQCDIYYIRNWSILLDLKIIILTALRIWTQKTAY